MANDRGKGRLVSQIELATLFGVVPLTIKAWERKGMPVHQAPDGPGRAGKYNTADIIRWREQQMSAQALGDNRSMEMEEAKRRKTAAEAASAELDLEIKRNNYVPVAEVANVVEAEYSNVRANFLSMPGEIAADLEHKTVIEIEELLSLKVTEILSALSAEDKYIGDDVEIEEVD